MYISFCPWFSDSFVLGVCTTNSKIIYKLSSSNRSIKQASNDHGVSQYLCVTEDGIPIDDSGSDQPRLGLKKEKDQGEMNQKTISWLFVLWLWADYEVLKTLKALCDISVLELDKKKVSQLVLKRTGKHGIINAVRISGESVETPHSQKEGITLLISAVLSPLMINIFPIFIYV